MSNFYSAPERSAPERSAHDSKQPTTKWELKDYEAEVDEDESECIFSESTLLEICSFCTNLIAYNSAFSEPSRTGGYLL